MKKGLKKAAVLAMAAAMAAGLTACGGGETRATTAAKTEDAAKAETTAAAKTEEAKKEEAASTSDKAEVTFWHSMSGKNGDLLNSIVETYNTSQDKIKVVAEYQGNYYDAIAKAQTAISAGNSPGIDSGKGGRNSGKSGPLYGEVRHESIRLQPDIYYWHEPRSDRRRPTGGVPHGLFHTGSVLQHGFT